MARGGVVSVKGQVFLSTHDNRVSATELSGFKTGSLKISEADESPSSFSFTANSAVRWGSQPSVLSYPEYATFIAPYLTVSWYDPAYPPSNRYSAGTQLGNFILLPGTKQAGASWTEGSYVCRDLTWLLAQDKVGSSYVVHTGTLYNDALKTLLNNAGITRINIATSTRASSKRRVWPAGTSRLKIANDILALIGFYPLWADNTGRLTSRRRNSTSKQDPIVSFSTAAGDIVETVSIEPDVSQIANRVVVIGASPKNNADGPPITAVRNNTRPDSPTSQTVLGIPGRGLILTRTIEDTRIVTQADADDRADEELAKGTSVLVRLGLKLRPNPLVEFRQPVALNVTQEDGTVLAEGKWLWDELQLGFTPADGAMSLRVSKVLPYGEAL